MNRPIEFIVVRPEAPLHLSVGFRAARWDPTVCNTEIVQMPREGRAKFRAIVGADGLERHREPLAGLVDEVNRRTHGVVVVNLQAAVAGRFIEGRELVKRPEPRARCFTSTWTVWPGINDSGCRRGPGRYRFSETQGTR